MGSPSRPAGSAPAGGVNPWFIAGAVMLATFMEVLDTSIAAVALPYIAGSVSATNSEATWVLTSYLVSNAIVLPASSWFSLRFGRKRFLLACIMIFTVSSFACGSATSLGMLLLARTIQGAGGGALQPLSQAILLESFPPEKRGVAMAVFALGVVVAPVLGPTLGGYLTYAYSWRWAFYINLPIGIMAVLMISRLVQDPPYISNARPGRFDGIAFGLLAVWLGALQIILDKGQEDDWFGATWIRWTTLILVIALVGFIVREFQQRQPLVNLRVFRHRNFALGCLLIGILGAVLYGTITLLPLFYQELLGYTSLAAGWAVSPRGIGAILAMPIIGVLTSKIDNRWLIGFGFFVFALCSLRFGRVDLEMGQWSLLWAIIISGFATGTAFVPLSTTAMARLANEEIGNASGLFNLLRNTGGSIGISIVNTIVARHQQLHQTELIHRATPENSLFQQQLANLQALLHQHSGAFAPLSDALSRAYALLQGSVAEQARLLSYVDDFRYMALVCFLCVPLVFALKRTTARPGQVGAGH